MTCQDCGGPTLGISSVGSPETHRLFNALPDTWEAIQTHGRTYDADVMQGRGHDYNSHICALEQALRRIFTGCITCGRKPMMPTIKTAPVDEVVAKTIEHNYRMGARHAFTKAAKMAQDSLSKLFIRNRGFFTEAERAEIEGQEAAYEDMRDRLHQLAEGLA